MALLVLILLFVFYFAPHSPPNNYSPTSFLILFSILYFIYFFLSALQIKLNYHKVKQLNSMMSRRGLTNNLIVTLYTAIPFLYEIKVIMDWTFSATSMTLFDWFKLFSIYLYAFKAKIQYLASTSTELGKPLTWAAKMVGWLGFTLILLIIFGPMILFSGLNPIAQSNLVIGGSLDIALQIINGNSFSLYSTSHFS